MKTMNRLSAIYSKGSSLGADRMNGVAEGPTAGPLRLSSRRVIANYGIILVLLLLILVFTALSPSFLSVPTMINIARQIATVGICAVGVTIVMISGGIDFSIGSLLALVNIVCAKLIVDYSISPAVAVLIGLLMAIIIGFINAFWITVVDIPPLITTLGMMTSMRGLAYVLSGGHAIRGFGDGFRSLGRGSIGFVPVPVIVMGVVFILGWLFLTRTRYGRFVYGMGSSEEAARSSGVDVVKMKFLVYGISGFLAAVAGVLLLSRLNTGLPKTGTGLEMEVVTAVVLGGVSIYGGKGSIFGVFVGVIIMGVLTTGMTYLNVTEYVQLFVRGLVLLLAIGFDNLSKKAKLS